MADPEKADAAESLPEASHPGHERAPLGLNGIPTDLPQWPVFGEEERAAVDAVLRSGRVNYWTGSECGSFEREFADYIGTRHAIALANGTLALELALHAFGIGAGDEVITTPRTFIASASAVVMRGAVPVFADVDRDSGNITAATIRERITPRTRAIIVVHLAGWPADMDAIMALAAEHDLVVIEDCAQAHGATWKGRRVGSIGHAGAFSFCQDKIITTAGEGGMLTLSDEAAWKRAWAFKDHGKDYDAVHNPDAEPGYRAVYHSFGSNWRLSEVQAAVGRVQLRQLDEWLAVRARNARLLVERLGAIPGLRIPLPDGTGGTRHAFYKLYAYLDPQALAPGWDRARVLAAAADAGAPLFTGSSSEIYLERAFAALGREQPVQPVAHELGATSLLFLVHPTLDPAAVDTMATRLSGVLARALPGGAAGAGPAAELHDHAEQGDNDQYGPGERRGGNVADWQPLRS